MSVIKNIVESIFKNFARNMMFIHIGAATIFFVLWQLHKHNIIQVKSSELLFGIFAIVYGCFCIYYYLYNRHK